MADEKHLPQFPQIPDMTEFWETVERRKEELAGRFGAEEVFSHLRQQVAAFQGKLDAEHELGIQLANFGLAAQVHVRRISFKNPSLIEFEGLLDYDRPVKLIQHINQLNFMLVAVPPLRDLEPYRVGF